MRQKRIVFTGFIGLILFASSPVWSDIITVRKPGNSFYPSYLTLTDNQISIRLGRDSAQVQACFHLLSEPANIYWPAKKIEWAWPMPTDWVRPVDFRVFSRITATKRDPEDIIQDYRTRPCMVPESFEIPKENGYYQSLDNPNESWFNDPLIDGVFHWYVFGQTIKHSFVSFRLSVEMRVTYTQPYNKGENGQSEFQYILRTGSTFAGKIGHLRIEVESEPGVQVLDSNWELQDGLIDTNEINPEKDLQITLMSDKDAETVATNEESQSTSQ